jgi:hypothetical protein
VAFWRDFDDWAMFHATPEVQDAEGVVFDLADAWFAYARDPAGKEAWTAAVRQDGVREPLSMLSERQRHTFEGHYGTPLPLLAMLDSFQQFGADSLPDDPERPADHRHRMNGASMWFLWGAFAEACVLLEIDPEFWKFSTRAILCGLLNDGLIRGRYRVLGFEATAEGQFEILAFVQRLSDEDLPGEVRRRFVDSGL